MVTPELSNYIAQSRSAGQSDEQIRQTLVSQGWQPADIDQAFGVGAVVPPPAAVAGAFPWTAIGLVALFLAVGVLGYLFVSSRPSQNPPSNQNNNQQQATDTQTSKKTCGTFDPTDGNDFVTLDNTRQHFPADFNVPPDGVFMGVLGIKAPTIITNPEAQSQVYGVYYFCFQQAKADVKNFIVNNNSVWDVDTSEEGPLADLINAEKKADGMTYLLTMQMVDGSNGYTALRIGYSGYK